MRRRWLWGLVAVVGYLGIAGATFRLADVPVRPLFDGPHNNQFPYRWLDPPPSEEPFNLPPESGDGTLALTPNGSRDEDLRTLDLQAGVVFPPQAFDPQGDETRIDIQIVPVDPDEVGPPPSGREFQGNAYRVIARYRGSGKQAPMAADGCDLTAKVYRCATILLRTPFGASDIARWDGDAWVTLPDSVETGSDIFADTQELGTFVALAEEGKIAAAIAARDSVPRSGTPLRDIIAIALGALAVVVATVIYRSRMARKRREEARRRAAGKRYKAPERKGKGLNARKK